MDGAQVASASLGRSEMRACGEGRGRGGGGEDEKGTARKKVVNVQDRLSDRFFIKVF